MDNNAFCRHLNRIINLTDDTDLLDMFKHFEKKYPGASEGSISFHVDDAYDEAFNLGHYNLDY